MIGHDHPRMHLVVSNFGTVLDRSQEQLIKSRLPEEGGAAASSIEQAVHGDESFSGGYIQRRKPAMCRKTVLQAEGDEQALADDFEMWEPTPSYYHILVVWRAFRDSPPGGLDPGEERRPTLSADKKTTAASPGSRPPQARGLPHRM